MTGDLSGYPDDDGTLARLFAKAKADPRIVRVGRTLVDVPATIERRFDCSAGACLRPGPMRALAGKACCTTFDVPLGPGERARIERVLPEIRAMHDVDRAIRAAGGWRRRLEGAEWLRTRSSGACVFLAAPRGEVPRCTLHEWALANGRDHRRVKPEICCLFPLYIVQLGDEILLTAYGSDLMLEADPAEAGRIETFVCTNPPPGAGRPLLVEQAAEISYRIGPRRWARVLAKLRSLGHPV
jgi:hypothetical protein